MKKNLLSLPGPKIYFLTLSLELSHGQRPDSEYSKSGSIFSSSEPVAASIMTDSDCSRLRNTVTLCVLQAASDQRELCLSHGAAPRAWPSRLICNHNLKPSTV